MATTEASTTEQASQHEELPNYATLVEPHKHLSTLSDRNGQPWLTLRLLSEAPLGYTYPCYYDGGTVRGSVQLDLRTPQTIRSVVIEVESKFHFASALEFHPFWHERKVLWDHSGTHDPKSITTSGSWSWDFSFPIPLQFDNSPNGGSMRTVLPGSFNLKPFPGYVEHKVMLFVKRGKYFGSLSEIHTLFAYVVRERAPPPSPLRELAYSEQRSPPGPSADPEGWKACDAIDAKGILFGHREVDVFYQPYLANPTTYPRGGTVFYRIDIQGYDVQGLDLLGSPSSVTTLLIQEVEFSPTRDKTTKVSVKALPVFDARVVAQGTSWATTPPPDEMRGNGRVLEGEISVPQRLSSSTDLALLNLKYSVVFVVDAAGFVPHVRNKVISRHPIRVVSHPALGVKPVSRIPPGYETKVTYKETDVQWALQAITASMGGSARAKGSASAREAFI